MNSKTAIPIALAWLALATGGEFGVLRATEPVIGNLNLRGLQIGGTTTLVIDGTDLGTSPRLLLAFPAKQELKPGGTANRATFDVTLDGQVTPGYHQLRVVSDGGVSLPVVIGVDRLPQRAVPPSAPPPKPEDIADKLPVALHGTVSGSASVEARFVGKAGQKVQLEVDAQRLGSKLRPVIHLVGPTGLEVGYAWCIPALADDARLEATLPADGTYIVSVHDTEYGPPGPGFFRLRIGQWSYVDQVFPAAVGRNQSPALELIGSAGIPRVNLPASDQVGSLPLTWPGDAVWAGPRPFVRISPHQEIIEPAQGAARDLPQGRLGAHGRLSQPYEEDRYRLAVTPGSKLRLDVFAERYGSPVDVALAVRTEKGDLLARSEDGRGTLDSTLEYAVPGNVSAILVDVVDAQGRGGPRAIYHLVIDPQTPQRAADFQLTTPAQAISVPVGGRRVIPVYLDRQGYQGIVQLTAGGLPPPLRLDGTTIPEGADGTLVTLQRADAAPYAAITSWTGRDTTGQQRIVGVRGHPLESLQPWLASEIAVASSSSNAAEFQIDWRNLAADAGLVPGGKLELPVKIARVVPTPPAPKPDPKAPAGKEPPKQPAPKQPPEFVRLTLMTSQPPPLVNGQPDLNRTIRAEQPVELPGTTAEGAVKVVVPAELPASLYDVTVQADLLAADRRTVVTTAFAPVRRMAVKMPVVVLLTGPPKIDVALDPKTGATIKLAGKIERREGLTGDVTVTLTGLPPGSRADSPTVKADATDFTLNIVLPPNQPAGEISGLKLAATGTPDPKQPGIRVKSREVDVTLVVRAPAK